MRGFSGRRAALRSQEQGLRANVSAHGTCFAIHVRLAVLAFFRRHAWRGAFWMLLPGVVVHLYPVLLQRSIMLRISLYWMCPAPEYLRYRTPHEPRRSASGRAGACWRATSVILASAASTRDCSIALAGQHFDSQIRSSSCAIDLTFNGDHRGWRRRVFPPIPSAWGGTASILPGYPYRTAARMEVKRRAKVHVLYDCPVVGLRRRTSSNLPAHLAESGAA